MIKDRVRAARMVVRQRLRGESYKAAVFLLALAGLLALGRGAPHMVPGDSAAAIVSDAGTGGTLTAGRPGPAEKSDGAKGRPQRLARGGEPLPVTIPRTVVIDAGHGGEEAGAYFVMDDGTVLLEKDLNLRVALATAERLRAAGQRVLLTRTRDAAVNAAEDLTGDGVVGLADDVQARIDFANEAGADVLVSIHFNGSATDEEAWELGGTEVYYNAGRPHSAESLRLAQTLYDHLVSAVALTGHYWEGRGVMRDDDATDGTPLYLLGPPSESIVRASNMPAAMGEALFVTNPAEAELLADDAFLEELALAYADAVLTYLHSPGADAR